MAKIINLAEKQLDLFLDQDIEVWVPAFGYHSSYEVSSHGNVRSVGRLLNKRFYPSQLISQKKTKCGYMRSALRLQGLKQKQESIHRLMMFSFEIPNPYNKSDVNHKDGNKANNFLWNLEWATGSENIRHAIRTGLKPTLYGDSVGTSKLKNSTVLSITDDLSQRLSRRHIADKYGLDITEIGRIARGERWSSITKIKPRLKDEVLL